NTTNPFGPVKIGAQILPEGTYKETSQGFAMTPLGDDTPFARQHRLVVDLNSNPGQPTLHLRDQTTNQDRWSVALGQSPMNQTIYGNLYQTANVNNAYHPDARYRFYHVKGHLIVCQVGMMIYGIDGDNGKKLWEVETTENYTQDGQIYLNHLENQKDMRNIGDG